MCYLLYLPNESTYCAKYNKEYVELKKRIPSQVYFKDFGHNTEQLSNMQISLQVIFKDFADRFKSTYYKNGFL